MTNAQYTSLEEYIRQGEPSQKERGRIWQTAIGLQQVDGLQTSDYLLQKCKCVPKVQKLHFGRNVRKNGKRNGYWKIVH